MQSVMHSSEKVLWVIEITADFMLEYLLQLNADIRLQSLRGDMILAFRKAKLEDNWSPVNAL